MLKFAKGGSVLPFVILLWNPEWKLVLFVSTRRVLVCYGLKESYFMVYSIPGTRPVW